MKGYEYVQLEYTYPIFKILLVIILLVIIVSCNSNNSGTDRLIAIEEIPKDKRDEVKKECYHECNMKDGVNIFCETKCYVREKR